MDWILTRPARTAFSTLSIRLSVVQVWGISRMTRVFSSTASIRARQRKRPLPRSYWLASRMPPLGKSGKISKSSPLRMAFSASRSSQKL